MKKMLYYLLVMLCTFALLPGCIGDKEIDTDSVGFEPKENEKLSEDELGALIFHAKQFLYTAKNLRLEQKHREIIRDTDPIVRIKYSAPKYGRIELEWPIAKSTVLLLSARGRLMKNKQDWVAEILTGADSGISDAELKRRREEDLAYEKAVKEIYGEDGMPDDDEGFGVD